MKSALQQSKRENNESVRPSLPLQADNSIKTVLEISMGAYLTILIGLLGSQMDDSDLSTQRVRNMKYLWNVPGIPEHP